LAAQIENLLDNAYELRNVHNESKGNKYELEADEAPEQMSLGSISSGDEDDCEILFNLLDGVEGVDGGGGEPVYRFQAEEIINSQFQQ